MDTDREFGAGKRWIELSIPGHETGVVLFTPDGHKGRIGAFYPASFTCENVHKTYDELSALGVHFDAPPKKEPWGSFAMLRDPDGNQFVLSSRQARCQPRTCY